MKITFCTFTIVEIIGYLLAIIMGLTLGLFGGGGSLLAVPILVYFFDVPVVDATAYSLIVVGLSATLGSIQKQREKVIRWDIVIKFAIPSLVAVYLTRRYLMPWLPESIDLGFGQFPKELLILELFCVLMLAAAYSMLRPMAQDKTLKQKSFPLYLLVLEGAIVGVLTGIVGAGGGFLIVPVLVVFMGLSMKVAVGTSLIIVAIKSVVGFIGDLGAGFEIDWSFFLSFMGLGVLGLGLGLILSQRVNAQAIKKAFGYFILIMAITILVKEIL